MKEKLPLLLIVGGAAINLTDAYTAKSNPTGGMFYGSQGALRAINEKLPVNLGVILMVGGLALWVWKKYG